MKYPSIYLLEERAHGASVTSAALNQQVAWALREERPQRRQFVGLIDVHPQEASLDHRVLVAPRHRPNRRGEEHLLAGVNVPSGERQQWRQPIRLAGLAAGKEVIGAPAGRDLQPAIATSYGGELDEPITVLVQDAELERAVPLRREHAGEDVRGGRGSAAHRARVTRAAGWGRRWLRPSVPPCSGMGSPAAGPAPARSPPMVAR